MAFFNQGTTKRLRLNSGFISKVILILFTFYSIAFAGETGKLSGTVRDSETNQPVIGANVIIDGTYLGAASDIEGYYFINNIPPGKYKVTISAVGYQKVVFEDVIIKIDKTTNLDITLKSHAVELKSEVVITAKRSLVQKDLTSTAATISSDDINMMPVDNINQVINLQAGVVDGHFRGGRSNDVAYLVDGVPVTDAFNGAMSLNVENSSVREMEIISGTFNAEYGQALSGVVNIVTQSGSDKFKGSISSYIGNFVTNHSDIFMNLNDPKNISNRDIQFNLSGPILPINNFYFFVTGRYNNNDGYLYGKRVYNVTDDVPYFPISGNNSFWIPRNTGDGAYVSMNPSTRLSLNTKLTYSQPKIKFDYSFFYNKNKNKYYDHYFSWTPDGIMTHYNNSFVNTLQLNYYPSQSLFSSLSFSVNEYHYYGYLFKDPFDPGYVNPRQGIALSGYTFRSGGNQGGRYDRKTQTLVGKWELSWQISKEHKITIGAEGKLYKIFNHSNSLVNLTDGQTDSLGNVIFTPGYPALGAITDQGSNIMYTKKPVEFSAFAQDKMEYGRMIINAGLRFDYFNPWAKMPADLRNPNNNPDFPGANQKVYASAKYQVSPRFGASFPITDQGIIRFSYGHFFKIPNFENLYTNPDFKVQPGQSLSSIVGNPDLKAEKTVMYEIGLQQVLFTDLVLNFSVYYRDIRNWLGMEIINTYEGFKYARFINRDYANVRGMIVTLEKRFSNFFSAKIDYTYQIAEGNASDPYAVYNNNQTNPPIEETKSVVPLDWDQRNTLNLTINIGQQGDWTAGLIFQYGSGTPYTEDIRVSKGVRFENGGTKPATYNLDLRLDKTFKVFGVDLNTFLYVYNVLDIKNEYGVYSTTGRANVDLNVKYAGEIIGLNTIQEYVNNPAMYSAPREIRLGAGFGF